MSIILSDTKNENILYSLDLLLFMKSVCTPKFSWLTAVESVYSMFRSDSVNTSVLKVLG